MNIEKFGCKIVKNVFNLKWYIVTWFRYRSHHYSFFESIVGQVAFHKHEIMNVYWSRERDWERVWEREREHAHLIESDYQLKIFCWSFIL